MKFKDVSVVDGREQPYSVLPLARRSGSGVPGAPAAGPGRAGRAAPGPRPPSPTLCSAVRWLRFQHLRS